MNMDRFTNLVRGCAAQVDALYTLQNLAKSRGDSENETLRLELVEALKVASYHMDVAATKAEKLRLG
jgi:hypothetical protein